MEIVLLTATWCVGCTRVKKFMDNQGIDYQPVDIDTDDGMMLGTAWNARGLPVAKIDGNVVRGEDAIIEALTG